MDEQDKKIEVMDTVAPPEVEVGDMPAAEPTRYGRLKCKCACGNVSFMTDDIIDEGISWTMIIGNDHFMNMHCEECGADLTMFIEEIYKDETKEDEDELPKESNEV